MFTDKDVFATMGERIRQLREAQGMTQTELAVACRVTKLAVIGWETHTTENIKLKTFLQLATVLGVSIQHLVYGRNHT